MEPDTVNDHGNQGRALASTGHHPPILDTTSTAQQIIASGLFPTAIPPTDTLIPDTTKDLRMNEKGGTRQGAGACRAKTTQG